ncbi:hypothetical protein AVEN_155471-1 [Araneus ventricosus]|uniref:Uncharacterized protein n=1 Tax=Araneus ventricosus TaxID=182803 RepID=A0A4Y2NN69_ARAVE|nr:hypothetical protein AVEN_155471-1 [Araneus ventricosus]
MVVTVPQETFISNSHNKNKTIEMISNQQLRRFLQPDPFRNRQVLHTPVDSETKYVPHYSEIILRQQRRHLYWYSDSSLRYPTHSVTWRGYESLVACLYYAYYLLMTHIHTNCEAHSKAFSVLVDLSVRTVLDTVLELLVHCLQPICTRSKHLPAPCSYKVAAYSSLGNSCSNDYDKEISPTALSSTAPPSGVR